MDIDTLINQISEDEINTFNILQLYNAVTIRRRIYFMKLLLIYVFIFSIITMYNWKYFNENKNFIKIIFIVIPLIPTLIYVTYTNIINPRYHYCEFILYITNHNDDYKVLEINNELIKEKLKEIHEFVEKSNNVCEICFNKKEYMIKLKCSKNGFHGGCIDCLTEWYQINNSCPECRQKIFEDDVFI